MERLKMLNGKQLREEIGISSTLLYKFRRDGMPYHQLPQGRPYYYVDEVEDWLRQVGMRRATTWVKSK